jgi:Putative transposase
VTDGGLRPDGTFVSLPVHDTARSTEAFRRVVLRSFVRLELFDEAQAAGMFTWTHLRFHVQAVWVPEDDRAFATRLARCRARHPVTLERLTYERTAKEVETVPIGASPRGRPPWNETVDPLEFLARGLVHIPDMDHVTTRYYGWYANRPRVTRGEGSAGNDRRATRRWLPRRSWRRRRPPAGGRRASASRRGRPARVSDLPRRNAHCRANDPSVGGSTRSSPTFGPARLP